MNSFNSLILSFVKLNIKNTDYRYQYQACFEVNNFIEYNVLFNNAKNMLN